MVRGSNSEPCTRIGSDGYTESNEWRWNEQPVHELGIAGPTTDIHWHLECNEVEQETPSAAAARSGPGLFGRAWMVARGPLQPLRHHQDTGRRQSSNDR